MSTLIYFSHILFLEILKLVLSNNLILFILVVILSILFSYIIIKLSNKFKFLKKIYSYFTWLYIYKIIYELKNIAFYNIIKHKFLNKLYLVKKEKESG